MDQNSCSTLAFLARGGEPGNHSLLEIFPLNSIYIFSKLNTKKHKPAAFVGKLTGLKPKNVARLFPREPCRRAHRGEQAHTADL